jgi:hypothetical protein
MQREFRILHSDSGMLMAESPGAAAWDDETAVARLMVYLDGELGVMVLSSVWLRRFDGDGAREVQANVAAYTCSP